MVFDSISNAPVTASAASASALAKKKRTNRSAKLKQCKLDARREQWLSQVKNKGSKEEKNGDHESSMHGRDKGNRPLENLAMRRRGEENNGSNIHDSDWDSPSNSPTSDSSVLGSNDSGTNFTGSSSSGSSSSSSSGGSSTSGGCCSGSITEEEEDDGCLDDWEAVADALAADDKQEKLSLDQPPVLEPIAQSDAAHVLINQPGSGGQSNPNCVSVPKAQANGRAWRPDDAFRPQSLPNLSKQHTFPMNSERHYGRGVGSWACKNITSVPSSCPICCEDLDMTDTSFLPCLCGFRLCLFCHKRILEEDGRCPGCRKPYHHEPVEGEATVDGGSVTYRLARSCSMITRS